MSNTKLGKTLTLKQVFIDYRINVQIKIFTHNLAHI